MYLLPLFQFHSYLHSSQSISWSLRCRIAFDIAQGMKALHSFNPPLLHRDLKVKIIIIYLFNFILFIYYLFYYLIIVLFIYFFLFTFI
jgi:serine/threonine protein kinase